MKGQSKPRITNIKQYFSRALAKMIGDSNDEYNEKVRTTESKLADKFRPVGKRYCAPKYRRNKPNPARRSTKTLNGEIKHLGHLRGLGVVAPTIDQVRALEQRIGLKVRVKDGKCHVGDSSFVVPINSTLEEAQVLLDKYCEKVTGVDPDPIVNAMCGRA